MLCLATLLTRHHTSGVALETGNICANKNWINIVSAPRKTLSLLSCHPGNCNICWISREKAPSVCKTTQSSVKCYGYKNS